MKRKRFSLKEEYEKSWRYIEETRNFIYFIVATFLVFTLVGFFIPAPESIANQIFKFIEELLEKTSGMSQAELISFILFNNLKSTFTGMIFGVFFGVFPMISAVTNGYVIGFVGAFSVESQGASVLLKLLPHGIFELPAALISIGMGLKLGSFIFQKNIKKAFKEYFWNSLRVFLLVVIPLLIIAAIIEGSLISVSG